MDEGSFVQLSCIVITGDEPLTISWTFHGQDISSDLGIMTTAIGTRGSMLIISSVGHRHSGEYTCTAKNEAGSKSETALLKVNGKNCELYKVTGRQKVVDCSKCAAFKCD